MHSAEPDNDQQALETYRRQTLQLQRELVEARSLLATEKERADRAEHAARVLRDTCHVLADCVMHATETSRALAKALGGDDA